MTCRPCPGRGSWQSDSAEQPRGDSRSVRGLLGLGEAVSVFSAAASLPPDVAAFFAGLGMTILDVYGMTETTRAFTANTPPDSSSARSAAPTLAWR